MLLGPQIRLKHQRPTEVLGVELHEPLARAAQGSPLDAASRENLRTWLCLPRLRCETEPLSAVRVYGRSR